MKSLKLLQSFGRAQCLCTTSFSLGCSQVRRLSDKVHEENRMEDESQEDSVKMCNLPFGAMIFKSTLLYGNGYTDRYIRQYINFDNKELPEIAAYCDAGFRATMKITAKYELISDWNEKDEKYFNNADNKVNDFKVLIKKLSDITGFEKNKVKMGDFAGIADSISHGFMVITDEIENNFKKIGSSRYYKSPLAMTCDHSIAATQSIKDLFKLNDIQFDFSLLNEKEIYLANSNCFKLLRIRVNGNDATVIARGKDLCHTQDSNIYPNVAILDCGDAKGHSMILTDGTKWDDNQVNDIKHVYNVSHWLNDKSNIVDMAGKEVNDDGIIAAYGSENEACAIATSKMFIDRVHEFDQLPWNKKEWLPYSQQRAYRNNYLYVERNWKSIVKKDESNPNVFGCHLLPMETKQRGSFLAHESNRVFGVDCGICESANLFSWVNQTMIDCINDKWKDEWYKEWLDPI